MGYLTRSLERKWRSKITEEMITSRKGVHSPKNVGSEVTQTYANITLF